MVINKRANHRECAHRLGQQDAGRTGVDNRHGVRSGLRFMISYSGRPGSNVAVSAAADQRRWT
jgi:hypothetical protein